MPVAEVRCNDCNKRLTLYLNDLADLWASDVSKVVLNECKPGRYEFSEAGVERQPAYYCVDCWADET